MREQLSKMSSRVALRTGAAAVAVAALFAGSLLTAAAANAAVAAQPSRGAVAVSAASADQASAVLKSGQTLKSGEERRSPNGQNQLRMQTDGNLVFVNPAKEVLFHTATAPNPGAVATMRTDGSLVVTKDGKVLFSTGSQGENAALHVQDDKNLTIRTPDGKVVWALSDVRREKSVLRSGQTLKSGEERRSPNGKIQLRAQTDGNIVLVNPAKEVLFHTATAPNPGAVATMRTDGNFVVTKDGKVLFSTGSQGEDVALHVQDDENLTIRTPDGKVVWALSDVRREKSVLRSGQTLKSGEERRSPNGKIQLRAQTDGNIVLVNPAKEVLFHTATAPNPGAVATMRTDGNFVVTKDGKVLFSTGTQGEDVALHVQDDENLTLRTADGKVVWASRP